MAKINNNTEIDESNHHSLVLRFWLHSLGELRGQFINPITNTMFSFTRTADMHNALDRAIEEIMEGENNKRKEI